MRMNISEILKRVVPNEVVEELLSCQLSESPSFFLNSA